MLAAEIAAHVHEFLEFFVLVDVVGFRKVTERFVHEYSGEDRVEDHSALPTRQRLRLEQTDCAFRRFCNIVVKVFEYTVIA